MTSFENALVKKPQKLITFIKCLELKIDELDEDIRQVDLVDIEQIEKIYTESLTDSVIVLSEGIYDKTVCKA